MSEKNYKENKIEKLTGKVFYQKNCLSCGHNPKTRKPKDKMTDMEVPRALFDDVEKVARDHGWPTECFVCHGLVQAMKN